VDHLGYTSVPVRWEVEAAVSGEELSEGLRGLPSLVTFYLELQKLQLFVYRQAALCQALPCAIIEHKINQRPRLTETWSKVMRFWDMLRRGHKRHSRNATVQLGLKVNASVTTRTAFEIKLYEFAHEHATNAGTARRSSALDDELKHTIQAIILAIGCLEAFINQEGIETLGQDFYEYDKGNIDVCGKELKRKRGYRSLEDKWCEITSRISNKQFDKGRSPFQDFQELVDLRNEILHNKAISAAPVPSPWPDVPGAVTPQRAKFNSKEAQKAVGTMKEMLVQFHSLTGKQLPDWIK
jgi:hypothetical protein